MKRLWELLYTPEVIASLIAVVGGFLVSVILLWIQGQVGFTTVVTVVAALLLALLTLLLYMRTGPRVTAAATTVMLVIGFLGFMVIQGRQSSISPATPIASVGTTITAPVQPTQTIVTTTRSTVDTATATAKLPSPTIGATLPVTKPPIGSTAPSTGMTPAVLSPGTGLGRLSFSLIEGCDLDFNIYAPDQTKVGEGKTSSGALVGVGTYDISLLRHSGGWSLSRLVEFMRIKGITIQAGQSTTIDLNPKIGAITVSRNPKFRNRSLYYDVNQGNEKVIYGGAAGGTLDEVFCLSSGQYRFAPEVTGLAFDIEIVAGVKRDLAQEVWPKVGLMSFSNIGSLSKWDISYKVYDQITGNYMGEVRGPRWIVSGKYSILMTKPYPGLTYTNIEIKAGEETILKLPLTPAP